MDVRFFAAKFGYIDGSSVTKEFETTIYQPKLTASLGDEDYTYSNYFIGRNEQTGFASQQIMMKDGGLKLRTDIFSNLQGRSDNWITSMNFNTSLPTSLIPKQIPLKIFLDTDYGRTAHTLRSILIGAAILFCVSLGSMFFTMIRTSTGSRFLEMLPYPAYFNVRSVLAQG